jgi:hypothetical protein
MARLELAPVVLPPVGQLRPVHRLRLLAEVYAAYLPLLRALRTNDLPAMAARARAVRAPRPVPAAEAHETAQRLGSVVGKALGFLPTEQRCLVRSLVLVRLLAARGVATRLVIGVRSEGGFGAHAWVEHDTRPVLPRGTFERLVDV